MDVEALNRQLQLYEQELLALDRELETLMQRRDVVEEKRNDMKEQLKTLNAPQKICDTEWEKKEFTWSKLLHHKLKSVFKIEQLRPFQLSAMNATLSGSNCILIMPTGGGKSLCYQLPALLSKGVTIVISPLIALMEDQLMALQKLGVNAEMLAAHITQKRQNEIMKMMVDEQAGLKLLYVSPEKLIQSKKFAAAMEKMYEKGLLCRIAIDEVHCCSQWGHDFRRDYKKLGILKRQFPRTPLIGLTATATRKVMLDVQDILCIQGCTIFKSSFNRPNLRYQVRAKPPSSAEAIDELANIITTYYAKQSGIVYCATIKESEEVATQLVQRSIKARPYHARLEARDRSETYQKWIKNTCQVVVATVAFGMGIDKPDVRFVIHYSISKSMENFYQESGRAGRDDKPADCLLLYRFSDVFKLTFLMYEELSGKKNLYSMIAYCIDYKRCRRSIIADHFGETWNTKDCNNMCDNCNPKLRADKCAREEVDVTDDCLAALQILKQAMARNIKMTALKLLDAWQGKVVQKVKFDTVKSNLSKEECEHILAFLLLEGYLNETYSVTPYNVISYITPNSRQIGTRRIKVDFKVHNPIGYKPNFKSTGASTSSLKAATEDVWLEPKVPGKREICVVPRSNSNATSSGMEMNRKASLKRKHSKVDELLNLAANMEDDLDFGEWSEPKRSDVPKPIMIDISENDDDDVMMAMMDQMESSM